MKLPWTFPNQIGLFLTGVLVVSLIACKSDKTDYLSANSVQLAPPSITVDSALFKDSALLQLQLAEPDAVIRYSLDGSAVTEDDLIYSEPIQLTNTAAIKVKAYHPQYAASEEQQMHVRKLARDISRATAEVDPEPHTNYPGNGALSLIDGQKGSLNFRKGGYWLGFQDTQLTVRLIFESEIEVSRVIISILQDQGSWIFAPQSISVGSNGLELGSKTLENSSKEGKKALEYIEVPINKSNNQEYTITINPLAEIPDWHPGKGTLPWTFIDEIMVE
ncbi:chitobiase/beta-hexosaminidase C-terminal domain-containing protein [Flagellimonas myxillae]|uniref:chitobiase/beta-hexosaminidase C-terminal domain-containing protein n=1 Tax=Flagellimonas myxillae TaxID=2942214 RepID=UPI00201EF845|nr:chitobiase/beta-hexosaminidase C-terminal domain-containing protein [Muricauda myxillae]MCL6267090.1 chitobiase/beta-hexosaminidase C-terminal domain-containing protein [Muricauda myxillae]